MSFRESIHPVPWPSVIQLALRADRLPRFIQTPVDAAYGCSVFSSSPELTFVWRTDSASRSIQTQVDAVNGIYFLLSPSGLTFAPGSARPTAMPTFVARRNDLRFRPRRRAFDSPRGDRVRIVTLAVTGHAPFRPPCENAGSRAPVHGLVRRDCGTYYIRSNCTSSTHRPRPSSAFTTFCCSLSVRSSNTIVG